MRDVMKARRASHRPIQLISAISSVVLTLALAACGQAAGGSGGGSTVPAGATKEDYQAALADMDPVTLTVQLPTRPDTRHSAITEAYTEAVTDWSGGKINFEMLYSGSRASATDVGKAMADGLVDMAPYNPFFEWELHPLTS